MRTNFWFLMFAVVVLVASNYLTSCHYYDQGYNQGWSEGRVDLRTEIESGKSVLYTSRASKVLRTVVDDGENEERAFPKVVWSDYRSHRMFIDSVDSEQPKWKGWEDRANWRRSEIFQNEQELHKYLFKERGEGYRLVDRPKD